MDRLIVHRIGRSHPSTSTEDRAVRMSDNAPRAHRSQPASGFSALSRTCVISQRSNLVRISFTPVIILGQFDRSSSMSEPRANSPVRCCHRGSCSSAQLTPTIARVVARACRRSSIGIVGMRRGHRKGELGRRCVAIRRIVGLRAPILYAAVLGFSHRSDP